MIPDNAKLRFIARAPTRDDIVELRTRVEACFEFATSPPPLTNLFYSLHRFSAAALATGCKHHIKLDQAYYNLVQNPVLGPCIRGEFKPED